MKKYNIKTILLPTNFSSTANNALSFAIELAKKCSARLVLVNVVEIPTMSTTMDGSYIDVSSIMGDLLKSSKSSLRETATEIMREHRIETEFCALQGFLYENVIRSVHLSHADIIVMGTGGADGISESLFGSSAFRIVNHSPVPVLTINENIDNPQNVKEIIYPFNEQELTLQKTDEIAYLAKIYNAEVLLFGVTGDVSKAKAVAKNLHLLDVSFGLKKIKSCVNIAEGENYGDEILKFCQLHPTALVAVSSKQGNDFLRLFQQKPDKKLVNHAMVPVLSIPVSA